MYYDLIEIGMQDFINPLIRDDMWVLTVDPVFEYGHLFKERKENRFHATLQVSDQDGYADCFFVPRTVEGQEQFISQIGKIPEDVPDDFAALVKRIKVPVISVPTLVDLYHIDTCEILRIASRGHNFKILESWMQAVKEEMTEYPERIHVTFHESDHAGNEHMTVDLLKQHGYDVVEDADRQYAACLTTALESTSLVANDESVLASIAYGSDASAGEKIDEDGFVTL